MKFMEHQPFPSVSGNLCLKRDACWEGSPMPEESASIRDNWLCISDWQITHQLVFGQKENRKGRRGEEPWGRFTFIGLGKLKDTII